MVSGYDKHPPEDDGTPKFGPVISFLMMLVALAFGYAVLVTLFGG